MNRYTLKLASRANVIAAHEALGRLGSAVTELGELQEDNAETWFLLADLDRNWWEITSSSEPNPLPLC